MISELLVNFLATDTPIAAVTDEIAFGQVPINADGELQVDNYIWIEGFDKADFMDLDGNTGTTEFSFNIECCSTDAKAAKWLGQLVTTRLQGHMGAFGQVVNTSGTFPGECQLINVRSQDDDYIPRNRFTLDEIIVVALNVTIWADDAQENIQGD